jgi:predicted nucleic acid-binding protein
VRIQKIYLETTVFNFYFDNDAPDKRIDTLRLFQEIEWGKYEPYTSDHVIEELLEASEPKQSAMLNLITRYNIIVLPDSSEAEHLAALYVSEGIIPKKYSADALHIAITTVNNLDVIVSYNFRHIVKMKTITMTEFINLRERYHKIGIYSPTEVIKYEDLP